MGSVHKSCLKIPLWVQELVDLASIQVMVEVETQGEELTWAGLGLDFIVHRGLAENVSSIESCSETSDGY